MMSSGRNPSVFRVMAFMAVFVLAGLPFVAYLWEMLNDALALKLLPQQLLPAIPIVLLFAGLLHLLTKGLKRAFPNPSNTPTQADEQ